MIRFPVPPAAARTGRLWRIGATGLLVLAAGLASPLAFAQQLTTVGGQAANGDGLAATSAHLRTIAGVARDAAGNLYLGDGYGGRIRRVDAVTGVITTYAGNGGLVADGDGGPATSAAAGYVGRVETGPDGSVYFISGLAETVRRVSPGGIITTIAGNGTPGYSGDGGPATAAQLNTPLGLAVDGAGNVFIADAGNGLVRRVDALTGEITSVAGDGSAGFSGDGGPATLAALNFPSDVDVDAAGNLYIADTGNFRVRRVDASSGDIDTVAGNGSGGFQGDGPSATALSVGPVRSISLAADGSFFLQDTNSVRIRRVGTDQSLTTVAGNGGVGYNGDGIPATSAWLNQPSDVEAIGGSDFVVADTTNYRVRQVTAGTISTVAGGDALLGDGGPVSGANFQSPYAVATDSAGNLFISDRTGNRIRRVDAVTNVITTLAGDGIGGNVSGPIAGARFNGPTGIAVHQPSGAIIVLDRANNAIKLINSIYTDVEVLSSAPIGFAGDGGPIGSARFRQPNAVAFSPDYAYMYIADSNNMRIRRWDIENDIVTTIAGNGVFASSGDGGPATSASLAQPFSLAVDAEGNIYASEISGYRIRRISIATGNISTVAGTGVQGDSGDGGPATAAQIFAHTIALGPGNMLYMSQSQFCGIRALDLATGIIDRIAGTAECAPPEGDGPALTQVLNQPFGITVRGQDLYIAEIGESRIRKLSPVGAPPVEITVGDASVVEGNAGFKLVYFPITLSKASSSVIRFDAATIDGTATAGSDYEARVVSGQTIAPGSTSSSVYVRVLGDTDQEGDESFQLLLSNPVNAVLGDPSGANAVIVDNDQPVLSIADRSINEGLSGTRSLMFTVALSRASNAPVSFDIATADITAQSGSDYVAASSTGVTIPAGATSASFSVTVNGDTQIEGTETFAVNVANVVGAVVGDGSAIGTLLDAGGVQLSIGDRSVNESASGTRSVSFVIRLSAASTDPVSVDVQTADGTATAGADYAAAGPTTVEIPAGATTAGFNVTVLPDTLVEGDETFAVQLSNPVGAAISDGEAIGTIIDAGGATLSVGDRVLTEPQSGSRQMAFVVRLSAPSASPVTFTASTVAGSATAGVDFTPLAAVPFEIPAGGTSVSVPVSVLGDLEPEAAEQFTLELADVVGAAVTDGSAIGTINDGGSLTATILDRSISEGNSGTKTLAFSVRLSAVAPAPVTFDVATADGSAIAGEDYTAISLTGLTIPAGSQLRSFTVRINGDTTVEANETFEVIVSNLAGATMSDTTAVGTISNDD